MSSTDTPVGTTAALLRAVQAQTEKIDNFKDEQVNVYTTQEDTATVTDASGNAVTVPSWKHIEDQITALQSHTGKLDGVEYSFQDDYLTVPYQVIPYGFRDVIVNRGEDSYMFDALVSSDGQTASSNLSPQQQRSGTGDGLEFGTAYFRIGGVIPSEGKWWFTARANPQRVIPQGGNEIAFVRDPASYALGTAYNQDNLLMYVDIFGDGIDAYVGNSETADTTIPVADESIALLFCIDLTTEIDEGGENPVDGATITAYYSGGVIITGTYARADVAGASIIGYMQPFVITDNSVQPNASFNFDTVFNVTNASLSPVTIPSGFLPLAEMFIDLPHSSSTPTPSPAPSPAPTPAPSTAGVRICSFSMDTLRSSDAGGTVIYTSDTDGIITVRVPNGTFGPNDKVDLIEFNTEADGINNGPTAGRLFVCGTEGMDVYSPYLNTFPGG